MPTQSFTISEDRHLADLWTYVKGRDMPFRVAIADGEGKRTDAQNRTVHKWNGEIAAQRGDVTAQEVKAECNLKYGYPIMSRDDAEWDAVFSFVFRDLNYENKLKAIGALDIPFTRKMNVKQLSEYMDQMSRDYRSQGFVLTDPEGKQ